MAYHLAWKYGKRWIEKVRRKKMDSLDSITCNNVSASFATKPTFDQLSFVSIQPKPSPILKEHLTASEFFRSAETYQHRLVTDRAGN